MTDFPEGGPERRAALTQEITDRTGIDEAMIERLVRGFYGRVQDDPLLAPIFLSRVEDWEAHIKTLCAFWSSVALMTGRYNGAPLRVHAPLPVEGAHFERWLALFEDTARSLCPPAAADHFIERAQKIAANFRQALSMHQGRPI